jgi:hypothetical protein
MSDDDLGMSGFFCRLPAVLFQQIEKRLIRKVLKFLLPIAPPRGHAMSHHRNVPFCQAIEPPSGILTTSPF